MKKSLFLKEPQISRFEQKCFPLFVQDGTRIIKLKVLKSSVKKQNQTLSVKFKSN